MSAPARRLPSLPALPAMPAIGLACALALAAWAALAASPYDLRVLTVAGVYAIMVLGYQFVFGHAGALSLAQGAFFGLGAYTTGILGAHYGLEFAATFPLSIAVPAALAALVAIPVLRLESHYFALATLALAQGVLLVAVNWVSLTGGANGIPGVPGIVVAGWAVPRGLAMAALVWGIAGLAALAAAWWLSATRRATFTVMREAALAAPAFGIDSGRLRLAAFVLSAAFAGAAGALYGHTTRVVSPEALGFPVMVACLTMTVLGGRLRIAGAAVGALALTWLPEWLRDFQEYYLIGVGALLLAMVVAAPEGLAALVRPRPNPAGQPPAQPPPHVARTWPARGPFVARTGRLALSGMARSYGGVAALEGVDMAVAPGEIVGLIGPNGSGKTTLANLATGFARPDRGRIALDGAPLDGLPPHAIARAGVVRTFQTPQLPGALTVREALAVAAAGTPGAPGAAPGTAADHGPDPGAILAALEIADAAGRPCADLPHGVRRRVELARALVARPAILVLDEPAAGLSGEEAAIVARALRGLAAAGAGVLVIDHDMDFLVPLADRLVCLSAGRVVAEGAPDAVVADPAVRAAYFGEIG